MSERRFEPRKKKTIDSEASIRSPENFKHTDLVGGVYWEKFKDFLPQRSHRSILDAGCGDGALSRELLNHGDNVVGVDYVPKWQEGHAERTPDLQLHQLNILDRQDNWSERFDLITSYYMMQHMDTLVHLEQGFDNLASYLEQDGRLCIAIPHPCFAHYMQLPHEQMDISADQYMVHGQRYRTHIIPPQGEAFDLEEFHYPLSDYITASSKLLRVVRMAEAISPSGDGDSELRLEQRLPFGLFVAFEKR